MENFNVKFISEGRIWYLERKVLSFMNFLKLFELNGNCKTKDKISDFKRQFFHNFYIVEKRKCTFRLPIFSRAISSWKQLIGFYCIYRKQHTKWENTETATLLCVKSHTETHCKVRVVEYCRAWLAIESHNWSLWAPEFTVSNVLMFYFIYSIFPPVVGTLKCLLPQNVKVEVSCVKSLK